MNGPTEVSSLGLLQQRSLGQVRPGLAEVADISLCPQSSLTEACSLINEFPCTCSNGNHCCGPAPVVFTGSSLLLWRLLPWAFSSWGSWLRPAAAEVACSNLLPKMSLMCAYSLGDPCLAPCPTKFSSLGLIPQPSLPCTCSCGGLASGLFNGAHWIRPVPINVCGLGLHLQSSLAWAWFNRGLWLVSSHSDVPDSCPDLQRYLTQACSFSRTSISVMPSTKLLG